MCGTLLFVMQKLIIYTDGGARGNPGPAGAGAVIIDGTKTYELKKYLGERQTNNWGRVRSRRARARGSKRKRVWQDESSRFAWTACSSSNNSPAIGKIKEATLKVQADKVRALLKDFTSYKFVYVPRAQNKEADRLVNEALDEVL